MKNLSYRALSGILLSFIVLVTQVPFQLFLRSGAQETTSTSEIMKLSETEAGEEMEKSLEELRSSIQDPRESSDLDTFQMMKQGVVDERSQNIEALRAEELLKDYLERVEFLERDIEALKAIRTQQEAKRAEARTEAQKKQANDFIEDAKSRIAFAQLELEDLGQFDPRHGENLNVDLMIDDRLKTRHYWGNQMKILVSQGDKVITEIKQRDFTQSLSPQFSANNPLGDFRNQGDMTFTIADSRGRPLHEFFAPVEAVFFFAEYLVYVESSQWNSGGKTLSIRFIDLNYARANLGNAPLPVFTLPLKLDKKPTEFKIENGVLKIGVNPINYPLMVLVSKMSQVFFNVSVSLVDPQTYEQIQPLIKDILDFLGRLMKAQDSLFQEQFRRVVDTDYYLRQFKGGVEKTEPMDVNQLKELIGGLFNDDRLTDTEYSDLRQKLGIAESLSATNQALFESRSLTTRIHLLMRFLMQPRPEGAPKIQQALLMLAFSDNEKRPRSWEFVKNSFSAKLLKYGAGVGVPAILGTMIFPDFFQVQFYKTVDLMSTVHAHFMGYLEHIDYGRAYAHLSKEAFIRVATGVTYFYDSYIVDDRWIRLLQGFGFIFLEILKPLAAIHIVVNSFIALKGIWRVRSLSQGRLGWLAAFYYESRQASRRYWAEKSEDIEKSGGGRSSDISPEEEKLLLDYLKRLKQGRASTEDLIKEIEKGEVDLSESLLSRFSLKSLADRLSLGGLKKVLLSMLKNQQQSEEDIKRAYENGVRDYDKMTSFSENMGETYKEVAKNFPGKTVRGVRVALANTFLSYPSLIRSFRTAVLSWNYPYLTRTYFYSPTKWLMFLIYPNFFRATMNSRQGQQHFPSKYNGGLELWPRKLHRMLSRTVNGFSQIPSSGLHDSGAGKGKQSDPGWGRFQNIQNFLNQWIISEKGLGDLRQFESVVIRVEAQVIRIARERAQKALMESIRDPDRLLRIFNSRRGTSIGISDFHDPKIKKLSSRERFFYRAYFTRTFELLMQSFVSEMFAMEGESSMDPSDFTEELFRKIKGGHIPVIEINEDSLKRTSLEKNMDYEQIRKWANELAWQGEEFLTKMDIQFRTKLLQSIHPENEQLGLVFQASKMAQKPQAMDRAVRAQISSLFTSIPLGIASTLVLFASVQSGLLQPFDSQGMDTETHFRYMSRYLFWAGFTPAVLLGIVAGTWMKVQEDARIDGYGGFDRVVKYSDGQRGFWRYYFKNVFKNPSNNWRANQLHYLKIIWHSLPAASVTVMATNLYGLGRVDLGIFISGYVIVFATPLVGFGLQLGQAFELASAWIKNRIPRKLRAHKMAMQYVDRQIQLYKLKQSYALNLFEIVIVQGVAGTLLTLSDSARYGTRAFIRLLFGGETLAELVSGLTDKMIEAFKTLPGIEPGMEAVRHIFTNNFEAWQRFPKELIEISPGVERVEYNSNLPKNSLGEVIGKTGAITFSWGLLSAIPYVGSHALQSANEKRLQRRGSQLRCSVLFAR